MDRTGRRPPKRPFPDYSDSSLKKPYEGLIPRWAMAYENGQTEERSLAIARRNLGFNTELLGAQNFDIMGSGFNHGGVVQPTSAALYPPGEPIVLGNPLHPELRLTLDHADLPLNFPPGSQVPQNTVFNGGLLGNTARLESGLSLLSQPHGPFMSLGASDIHMNGSLMRNHLELHDLHMNGSLVLNHLELHNPPPASLPLLHGPPMQERTRVSIFDRLVFPDGSREPRSHMQRSASPERVVRCIRRDPSSPHGKRRQRSLSHDSHEDQGYFPEPVEAGPTGGMIFGCTTKTKKECERLKLFGLPGKNKAEVLRVVPGTTLFLFNYNTKQLSGVYEATSYGGWNIVPDAFKSFGSFPAQVKVRLALKCPDLPLEIFKKGIFENFYTDKHFKYELNSTQVERLLNMFMDAREEATF